MGVYSDIESHRGMVFDEVRNTAYATAIERAVTPNCTVLDLGAGVGIHGLLAAAAGAGKVYLVDPSCVAAISPEIAKANALADRVQVIRGRIEELDLDARVDVIVSVFTGHFLLTEDLLPLLFRARDRFLKPGGVMLPSRGQMKVALVTAEAFYRERIERWSQPTLGLDFSPVRRYAANGVFYANAERMNAQRLTEAATLLDLDFMKATRADCRAGVELVVQRAGTCHGVVGWFDILLGDVWLTTAPDAQPTHWSQAFFPLDPPMHVQQGDCVKVEFNRPEFGEWTWTVSCGEHRQRHSTFQNHVPDLNLLKKQTGEYETALGSDGQLALFVLGAMERGARVGEILAGCRERFPDFVARSPHWEHAVRALINQWDKNPDPASR